MRVGLSTVVLAACSVAEPDELEIRVTTGAIARDVLSQVNVTVDPPRTFLRDPEGGELAPGVTYEFFDAGTSNRLLVSFRPPSGSTTLTDDLVFTAELHGGFGELGKVRAVGYDRAGQAIAVAERLDVPFGGFEALTLTLACPEEDCGPSAGVGGYPVTLDIATAVPMPGSGPARLTMARSTLSGALPDGVFVFGDPAYDNNRGRIAIVDAGLVNDFSGDFDDPDLLCVIDGDAPNDQFGTSMVFGLPDPAAAGFGSPLLNPFLAVGAPGANGGAGAVYVVQSTFVNPGCRSNISGGALGALTLHVTLGATGSVALGHSLAFAPIVTTPGGFGTLVIGSRAPNDGSAYLVRDLSASSPPATRSLDSTNSLVIKGQSLGEFGRVVVGGNDGGPVAAIASSMGVIVVSGPDALVDKGERNANSLFGISVPGAVDALAFSNVDFPTLAIGSAQAADPTGAVTGAVFIVSLPGQVTCGGPNVTSCLYGLEDGDELGASVSFGHFRKPGDLMVGAPGARRLDDGAQAGAVYVVPGEQFIGIPTEELRPIAQFGRNASDSSIPLLYRLHGSEAGGRLGVSLLAPDGPNPLAVIGGQGDGSRDSLYIDQLVPSWGPRPGTGDPQ